MVQLPSIMDAVLLEQHIKNGLVSRRYHNEFPLAILNYTAQCQYSWAWDDVTEQCRGLIYNTQTLEIVARPFRKFHNWDQSGAAYPPSGPCLRMEKMDGSLGILYSYSTSVPGGVETAYRIATRGSFHSVQAEIASREMLGPHLFEFDSQPDKTYLFEIIYPENRIVVDYGNHRGLTLLDVIDTETGLSDTAEFDECNWPDKVTRIPMPGFDVKHVVDIPQGGEGFVYLWPVKNVRYKMKSAEYVHLHRLVTGLNEKAVWQHLVDGKTLDELKVNLPEEFHKWIDDVANAIFNEVEKIVDRVYGKFNRYSILVGGFNSIDRKSFALHFAGDPDTKYLFAILDGKAIYPIALRASKPKTNRPLVEDDKA